MLTKITIIVALSCGVKFPQVLKQMDIVKANNPGAVISYRIDKKAACDGHGHVLVGKDAKSMLELGN